jgi:hypothetical protein
MRPSIRAKIGLLATGHQYYWDQFPGLRDMGLGMCAHLRSLLEKRADVVAPDLVDSAVFVHPQWLRDLSEPEIDREITELGKRIGRGYILFSDLEIGTRDSQIRAAYAAAARL